MRLLFASAAVLALAGQSAAAATSWKSFFTQTNLAAGDNAFHAEKRLGVYVEIDLELPQQLPAVLASLAASVPSAHLADVDQYLAHAEQAADARLFAVVHSDAAVSGSSGSTEWLFTNGKLSLSKWSSRRDAVTLHRLVDAQVQGESLLVRKLVDEFKQKQQQQSSSSPAFVVWRLPGSVDLVAVASAVHEIQKQLSSADTAAVMAVAFHAKGGDEVAAKAEVQRRRRRLAETGDKVVVSISASQYVLMCWVLVALGLLAFFAFCCIPWAPELDTGLRSSLKSKGD